MSIKYCYKEEIHKSFTIPITFNALLNDVKTVFEDTIPTNFSIQYKDSEGDLVTISSDSEYRSMLRFDVPESKGSIKLYINPSQKPLTEKIDSKIIFVSNKNSEGSFEVINTSKSGTDGGISEFTLTSDDEKNNRSQRSPSSDSKKSKKSDTSLDGASTSSPKNDSSGRQQDDTLDNLYEIRALLLKECFAKSPKIVTHEAEAEAVVNKEESENSLERLLNIIDPRDYKNKGLSKSEKRRSLAFVDELNHFRLQEDFAVRTIQRAFRRLKNLKNEGKEEFDMKTVKRAFRRLQAFRDYTFNPNVSQESDFSRESSLQQNSCREILDAAAIFIQKNYRGYRTRKMLEEFFFPRYSCPRYSFEEELPDEEVYQEEEDTYEEDTCFSPLMFTPMTDYDKAAETIQKVYRGFIIRKRLNTFASYEQASFEFEEPRSNGLNRAAVQIQKVFRGCRNRRLFKEYLNFRRALREEEDDAERQRSLRDQRRNNLNRAAVQIQKTFRGYRLRKVLDEYLHSFDRGVSERDDEETEEETEEQQQDDEVKDSWQWAQERVQAQNCQLDSRSAYENNYTHSPYAYQPMSLRSNTSYDSHFGWKSDCRRAQEVSEDFIQSPVQERSYERPTLYGYEHHEQNEDVCTPRHPWLKIMKRNFELRADSHPSPRSVESPYSIESSETPSRLRNFQRRLVQDYKYRLMEGISSSLLFFGPNNGKMIVYKTIYIENTGVKPWNKCYVKSIGAISGKTAEIRNVEVGQIVLVTLELSGQFDYGYYNTHWRLVHENENGMVEGIGEAFNVEFTLEPKQISADRKREADQTFQRDADQTFQRDHSFAERRCDEEESEQEESVQEESVKELERDQRYEYHDDEIFYESPSFFEQDNVQDFEKYINYRNEAVKVGEIRTMFPLDSLDEILAFVNQRPNLTTEEVVLSYLAMRNEC